MNNNINIADILRDCPKGTKLYSPMCGNVKLCKVEDCETYSIHVLYDVRSGDEATETYNAEGKYRNDDMAECMLFPSREMRDWRRFFKKGDILYSIKGGIFAIFKEWSNEDYTRFICAYCYSKDTKQIYENTEWGTTDFLRASKEGELEFIDALEQHYHGKYNPDALEVEPLKPMEHTKPECHFMPFDKVLGLNGGDVWEIDFFSRMANDSYYCLHGMYEQCVPYNESTAHLLGTKDPYEEGGE